MAQISYGSITVSDVTDIEDVYFEYALAKSDASETSIKAGTYTFSQAGERDWSITYPTWTTGYQVWVREVKKYANIDNVVTLTPYLDKAINDLNNIVDNIDIDSLQTKLKYIWINTNNNSHPRGTYAASGREQESSPVTFNINDQSTYGFNTHLAHNALDLRYNDVKMTSLTTGALTFYVPMYKNGSYVQGGEGLILNANGLRLFAPYNYRLSEDTSLDPNKTYYVYTEPGGVPTYTAVINPSSNPHQENYYEWSTAATLNQNGLNITEGSITLGEEDNNTFPFQVTSDGYLRAQTGWIGGENSYVRLEKSIGEEGEITHYLDIRLSQLDMLLNGDIYGQENVIDVLDLVSQQDDFIKLWNGENIWLYALPVDNPSGNPKNNDYYELINKHYILSEDTTVDLEKTYYNQPFYTIYQYTNSNTDATAYYYNLNEYDEGSYELTTDTQVQENSIYYKKTIEGNSSGAIVSVFKGQDATINSLIVNIESTQSGAGTPSLNNIRPINGSTEVNVIVSPTMSEIDGNIYTTEFNTIVYGGTFNVINGLLTITHNIVNLGSLTWNFNNESGHKYYNTTIGIDNIKVPSSNTDSTNILCSAYAASTYGNVYNMTTNGIIGISTTGRVGIYDKTAVDASMSVEDFKTRVSGITLVYELNTPLIYHLTSQQINLLSGINNLWASNGTIDVEVLLDYDIAFPVSNPQNEGFYELKYLAENWTEYTDNINDLPVIQLAGLGQALKFEDDSLNNKQKLIVSSARGDEHEKTQVEIDPYFINFSVKSDDISPLQMSIGYMKNIYDENDIGSTYMNISSENRNILAINENNGYFLETDTGFKIGTLGMFHYQNGLAIGII